MAKLKYRCNNYGECEKADSREVIELSVGEEPICAGCTRPLLPDAPAGRRSGPPKAILLAAAAVILIGSVIAAALHFGPGSSRETMSVEAALQEVWPWLK